MIRIVEFINSIDRRGGAEVLFFNLCKELKKRDDVEVIAVSLFDNIDSSFDFEGNGIKLLTCGKRKKLDFKASKRLKKIISDFNPDIINSHLGTIVAYFLSFGFKRRKWKIFHTVHNIAKDESTAADRLLRKPYIRKSMLNFIGISDQISQSVLEIHPKAHVRTIYNGIPLQSPKKEDKTITFICPARYSESKNHKMLFDVFNKYCDIFQDSKLVCFGSGETGHYKDYISTLSHGDRIEINGQITNVDYYLNKSKFLVLSSLYEGNPISILEALSTGVPCVVPSVGGIPDVIHDGVNGFLFEVSDNEGMLKKMIEATNVGDYSEMSKICIESVKKFSIEFMTNEYVSYFCSTCGGNIK